MEPDVLIKKRVAVDYMPSELCNDLEKPFDLYEVKCEYFVNEYTTNKTLLNELGIKLKQDFDDAKNGKINTLPEWRNWQTR